MPPPQSLPESIRFLVEVNALVMDADNYSRALAELNVALRSLAARPSVDFK